ncbi:MAG: hypothetical protein HFE76_14145 [Firmicutes bacterium]|nr:hypothetical protein [Bacillota bacterium]
MKGFIKVYREICDNPLWNMKPFSKAQAWIDLLLLTNHTDSDILIGNTKLHVKRGQVFRAIHTLEERWGWSRKKVREFLKFLETEKMATAKGTAKGTLIAIENWDLYQVRGPAKRPDKDTAQGQQRATYKNDKNDKEEDPPIILQLEKYPKEIQEAFMDFIEMREKIKAPMTERAITVALNKMDRLSGGDPNTAVAILEQSIMNNWKSLYPLKDDEQAKNTEKQIVDDGGWNYGGVTLNERS